MKRDHRSFYLPKLNWLWITAALLVILLAIINILLSHPLTTILTLLFCFIAMVIKKPNIVLLLTPVLILLIFKSQPLNTFGSLREQFTSFMSKPEYFLTNIFTPKSGMEVLPEQALQIHELIDQFGLSDYWLTDGLQEDNEIKEKIIESSWPVIIDSGSPYVFGYRDEFTDRDGCTVIGTQLDIELGYCD